MSLATLTAWFDRLVDRTEALHRSERWRASRAPVPFMEWGEAGPVVGYTTRGGAEGEPLTGAAPRGLFDALSRLVWDHGYSLTFGPTEDGEYGYTSQERRLIHLTEGMSDAQTVATLAHEVAHMLLHRNCRTRHVAEVEAESVAHLVLAANGLDSAPFSVPYVADWSAPGWRPDRPPGSECQGARDVFARSRQRVLAAAALILLRQVDAPERAA